MVVPFLRICFASTDPPLSRTLLNELPCTQVTITEQRKTARTLVRAGTSASLKDARERSRFALNYSRRREWSPSMVLYETGPIRSRGIVLDLSQDRNRSSRAYLAQNFQPVSGRSAVSRFCKNKTANTAARAKQITIPSNTEVPLGSIQVPRTIAGGTSWRIQIPENSNAGDSLRPT